MSVYAGVCIARRTRGVSLCRIILYNNLKQPRTIFDRALGAHALVEQLGVERVADPLQGATGKSDHACAMHGGGIAQKKRTRARVYLCACKCICILCVCMCVCMCVYVCILRRLPHLLCLLLLCMRARASLAAGLATTRTNPLPAPFMNPPKSPFLVPCRRKHNRDSPSLKKQWMCMDLQRNAPTNGMLDECRKLNKEITRT